MYNLRAFSVSLIFLTVMFTLSTVELYSRLLHVDARLIYEKVER